MRNRNQSSTSTGAHCPRLSQSNRCLSRCRMCRICPKRRAAFARCTGIADPSLTLTLVNKMPNVSVSYRRRPAQIMGGPPTERNWFRCTPARNSGRRSYAPLILASARGVRYLVWQSMSTPSARSCVDRDSDSFPDRHSTFCRDSQRPRFPWSRWMTCKPYTRFGSTCRPDLSADLRRRAQ